MKKILLSMSLLLALPTMTFAGPRSIEEMKAAAQKAIPAAQGNARSVVRGELKVLKAASQLTVLGYQNGGYAVIANDDKFDAVLGYSDTQFGNDVPPAMQWWMDAINASMEQKLAEGAKVTPVEIPQGYAKAVEGLTKTTWGQNAPFWNMTPLYTVNGVQQHYVTGCVATSMSQVMKYHGWPDVGSGYSSYTFSPDGGASQTLSADYDRTRYDWANMLDSYADGYNDAQADAVATLMSHAGISVEMQYNTDGSGARSVDACKALKTYFKYNENGRIYERDFYGINEWMQIIYRELNDGCPLLYGGSQANGYAHSFILDGYNDEGLIHVNWGWNGSSNGYYDIASLGGYAYTQEMVVVRMPDDPTFTDKIHSCWGTRGNIVMSLNGFNIDLSFQPVSLQIPYFQIINCVDKVFTGELDLVAENLETHEVTPLDVDLAFPALVNVEFASGFTIDNGSASASISRLLDGQYRIYFASKANDETEWYPVRSHESYTNNYILTINGYDISLEQGDNQWTAGINGVEVDADDDGMARVYTASGVEVYAAPAASFSIDDVPATGLLIVKKGGETTKVMKK